MNIAVTLFLKPSKQTAYHSGCKVLKTRTRLYRNALHRPPITNVGIGRAECPLGKLGAEQFVMHGRVVLPKKVLWIVRIAARCSDQCDGRTAIHEVQCRDIYVFADKLSRFKTSNFQTKWTFGTRYVIQTANFYGTNYRSIYRLRGFEPENHEKTADRWFCGE